MKIDQYLLKQEEDLIAATNSTAHYPTGVESLERITIIPGNKNLKIDFDSNVRNKQAFIVYRESIDSYEYWVHVNFNNYRNAYINFLNDKYGVDKATITSEWNVDHILSRAFAKKYGISYVRMCLLHKNQNSAYGRRFEKKLINHPQNNRGIFLMSYAQLMKIINIPIPKDRNDFENRKSDIVKQLIDKGVKGFEQKNGEFLLERYFVHWNII